MESIRQIIAILFVLVLLGGALYWLRAKGMARLNVRGLARGNGRKMQLIEHLRLSPQHSLHLVSVGGRLLLVAVSPGGCSVVSASALEIQIEDGAVIQ